MRRPRAGASGVLLVALAGVGAAHWVAPETIVAGLNGDTAKAGGVVRAERDLKEPRLLVIRVGPAWYARPAAARRAQASAWFEHWRANVPQGIVAVLDARTDTPVVHFRRGAVAQVTDAPPPP